MEDKHWCWHLGEAAGLMIAGVSILLIIFWAFMALAQSTYPNIVPPHGAGHGEYRKWASQKTGNCCNNQDCRGLKEGEWREKSTNAEFGTGIEVKIEDKWCPVEREHFIVTGKSPDATIAHACIRAYAYPAVPTCDRLLCFVGPSKS